MSKTSFPENMATSPNRDALAGDRAAAAALFQIGLELRYGNLDRCLLEKRNDGELEEQIKQIEERITNLKELADRIEKVAERIPSCLDATLQPTFYCRAISEGAG